MMAEKIIMTVVGVLVGILLFGIIVKIAIFGFYAALVIAAVGTVGWLLYKLFYSKH